jgi:hypothetical protein
MIQVYRSFSLSLQANAGIVPRSLAIIPPDIIHKHSAIIGMPLFAISFLTVGRT